jgi:hypothetical protein
MMNNRDQEIAALKAERDQLQEWCRKLIESGTFPGEADELRAERDKLKDAYFTLFEAGKKLAAVATERDELRATLDGAYEALENNDEAGALLILKVARRALSTEK